MSFLCALLTGSLCTLQGETEAARSPTHSEKLGFGRRAELFCSSWTGLKLRWEHKGRVCCSEMLMQNKPLVLMSIKTKQQSVLAVW